MVGFDIAGEKWKNITEEYNVTKFYKLKSIAEDLMKTAPNNQVEDTYSMIAKFTYADGNIDVQEAEMLLSLLERMVGSE